MDDVAGLPRTVLVTGAAGYVGGTLVSRLLEHPNGPQVVGVDQCRMPHGDAGIRRHLGHPRLRFVRADVRETSELQPLLAKADAVVHLAAIVGDPAARREPDLARSVNLEASRRLIEGCAEARIRHLVFVSTCSNYGVASPETLAAEDHPLNPLSLYAETKVGVERILLESSDLPFTCLRLATVYGVAPRMRFDLTVNQFTIEAHMARFLSIFNEDSWRPYVHVDDVARAIQTTLARPAQSLGRVFNVGNTDENYTKRMMQDLLVERVPGLRAEWTDGGDDPRSYRVSFRRISDDLGYETRWRVPTGMDEILRLARLGAYSNPHDARFSN